MSNTPENDLNLDLHFLPAWAQQSPDINRYAHFTGDEGGDRRRSRREGGGGGGGFRGGSGGPGGGGGGPRPERRGPGFESRRPGPGGPRPQGGGGGAPGGPRPQGERRSEGFRGDRRGPRPGGPGRDRDRDRRPEAPPQPLLELNVVLHPDEKGVDSLARQIKMSGRAYPLFEIAQMILKKPERHAVILSVKKNSDGTPVQPLFSCALDDSLWLSESEAAKHVLDHHFGTFYRTDKVPVDPPKGVYTFVAQCGMSGVILGPPNHHDYQNQLRRLHAERFSRLPFEAFKARVRIVREEAVVKKWVEDQSFKSEYECLNVPEPLRLQSREELEEHFRKVHLPNLVRPVESITLSHEAVKALRLPSLQRLIRSSYDTQRRFPLQIATLLSQQFASRGLQFFKVDKTVTHVAVARPHYLDLDTNVVSDGVKNIVRFIDANAGCTRRKLFDALMPGAFPPNAAEPAAPAAAAASSAAPAAAAGTEAAPAAAVEKAPLSPELQAFIADLHWLIHQGHVIEFATGVMETAKKPAPKPVKATPQKAAPAPAAASEASAEPASSATPAAAPAAAAASEADAGGSPAAEVPSPS